MNTMTTPNEDVPVQTINPGAMLASIREQKKYTVNYVAGLLNLRSSVIQLIEQNDYQSLPGPAFVQGYLRAYAKVLDISPEPYIVAFNEQYTTEKKPERTLWQQTKREPNKSEHIIRWFTILFVFGVIIAVGIWWQKNQDSQQIFSEKSDSVDLSLKQNSLTNEIKLTDISKMHSLLNPKPEMSPLEKIGD